MFLAIATTGAASAAARPTLVDIPEPQLQRLEPSVRDRLTRAGVELDAAVASKDLGTDALGAAYGEAGRLYHAHHVYDPAAACYRNASALAPREFRWHYLLGWVYEQTNQLEDAAVAFAKALEIRPDDGSARLHLAEVYLALGRHEDSAALTKGLLQDPQLGPAAAFITGKSALAQRDYARAVELLEQALAAQPQAGRIRFPLAMAYRGMGDAERAREHLDQPRDGNPWFPDPELDALDALAAGPRAHIERAMAALQANRFDIAAKEFGEASRLEPDNVATRVKLARSLYMIGQPERAARELQEAVRREPDNSAANFFLGVMAEERGNDPAAIRHYRTTLQSDPGAGQAQLLLAGALMRMHRPAEALEHYTAVVQQAPHNADARLQHAMAMVRTGTSHAKIRADLEAARRDFPEDTRFAAALARLMAASPDAGVRDGQQALEIATSQYEGFHSPANAEMLAMAHAELGQYDQAASLQAELVTNARQLQQTDKLPGLEENLRRYENGQPCRTPWRADDPAFHPPRLVGRPASFGGPPMPH